MAEGKAATTLVQAAAPAVMVTLADGKEHRIARIDLDMLAEFEDWLDARKVEPRKDEELLEMLMRHMQTIRGMRWLLWRALWEHDPTVELKSVGKLLGGIDQMAELAGRFIDLPTNEDAASADPQEGASTGVT